MRIATHAAAAAASALLAASPAHPAHAQLRAHAGVVAGNARFGPGFRCATSGPAIGAPWFAGVTLPTEGIAACGLAGSVDDRMGSAGPLTAVAAGVGPMASTGTFGGTARARADYWRLGVAARGTATGDLAAGTYHQAAAYASFADELTLTSPGVPNGTAGSVDFTFLVEGMLRNLSAAPSSQQGDVALAVHANGILWTALAGATFGDAVPIVRGGSTGLPGGFVLSPGALAGAAAVTTTGRFAFVWGDPFHVEVALYTSVFPCCSGASIGSDFYDSARLTGITASAPGGPVGDFVVAASSGRRLGAGGIVGPSTPVPEPGPLGSTLLGLAAIGWSVRLARRRTARRRAP